MTLPVVRRSNARMGRSPATRCMRNAAAVLALVLTASTGVAMPRGLRRPRTVPHAAQGAQPGPACRPGGTAPQLSYHGGDLVAHAAVFVLFWGSEWQGDPEHQAAAAALRAFFQTAGTSPYACSLREFSVPGVPIDTGSFLGDAVITVPPVSPPETELEDDVIRGRIADEVSAQRAPAPTADTVYVVVPPKGVPVRSFGETGCGGSNFTFCGYHDSFLSGGRRFRYAVLPFPCSQDRGTCFVDAAEDPGRALQAVGSHELAETITDPDRPPVGPSGWFDNRLGQENADICHSDGCLVELPVGGDTFAVNSLWSNLAGGCVASAGCSPPPVQCTDTGSGACVVNERDPRGCALEALVDPNLGRDRVGLPSNVVSCADGQPFCDFDGVRDGRCTFHVAICLNSSDPRVACTPAAISAIRVASSGSGSAAATNRANVVALLAALRDIDPASTGSIGGSTVRYSPAASTRNACSQYLDVVVPLRRARAGAPSASRLRLMARTSSGVVRQQLKLICAATFF